MQEYLKTTNKRRSFVTEKQIKKSIIEFLKWHKVYCWNVFQGLGAYRGCSDILGILPDGKLLAIEVKTPAGQPSQEQLNFIENINKRNGIAFVARCLDDVKKHLNGYLVIFFLLITTNLSAGQVLDYIMLHSDLIYEAERKKAISIYLDIPDQIKAQAEYNELIAKISNSINNNIEKIRLLNKKKQEIYAKINNLNELIKIQEAKIKVGPSIKEKIIDLQQKKIELNSQIGDIDYQINTLKNEILNYVSPQYQNYLLKLIDNELL